MDVAAKYQALLEQSLVGVFLVEAGVLREVNASLAGMFGFSAAADLVDRVAFTELVAAEDSSRVQDHLQGLSAGKFDEARFHFTGLRQNGVFFRVEAHVRRVDDPDRCLLLGVLVDASELCRVDTPLKRQAYHDALTGLPNRTLYFDRLKQAIAVAQREDNLLAFLYLDLDDFRQVNDQYGQEIGDQALIAVAGRFSRALRATDTLARLGGDEFAVIAGGLTFGDDVIPVALKLIAALESPVVVADHRLTLGVSMGISLFPHHAANADELYRAAEAAMYGAKDRHRGGFCFYVGNIEVEEAGGALPKE
ncbi:MAG TPA: sensor domain-containing diguanylate cyclase [Rhodocyclaceae bacterium]|nr:sensor domain-containing diguanylate cyclase [Rhodocyclaceae bacterium]